MDADPNKALVRRLVDEVVHGGHAEVLDAIADGEFVEAARAWIGPFRRSFPDFHIEIVELIGEHNRVAAHFRCSGTHRGEWDGHAPTGRRFLNVDEIYLFQVRNGRITAATGVEDNLARLRQLGLYGSDREASGPTDR